MAELLHGPAFVDQAPATVYAQLLDQGRYLCSVRTMYRILEERREGRERRLQRRFPRHEKPMFEPTHRAAAGPPESGWAVQTGCHLRYGTDS